MSRTPRSETTRQATGRPALGGGNGRLHIDPSKIPGNEDWLWVRESTLGEYDEGNVQARLEDDGYSPVLVNECPDLAPKTLPGRERKDALIRRGGLVLMKRPKELADAAQQQFVRKNQEVLENVDRDRKAALDGRNFQASRDDAIRSHTERAAALFKD